MNLPNKLTVLRLIMVPVFFISFCLPEWFGEGARAVSVIMMLICYATAELSDLLDGKIARKHNLVTDLGKVMDPFADTLSHLTFFVCFYSLGLMPSLALIIIIWREFSMNFMRMLMMGKGKAVAANIWGKSKTVLYAIDSILSIAYIVASYFAPGAWQNGYLIFLTVMFYLAALASLLSFTTYMHAIIKSRVLSSMTR